MIKVLNENLINKIAAGEVIERPVNVVKELVENSLDANASSIVVSVEQRLISIEDDGDGMEMGDLVECVKRHATSKIVNYTDLEDVRSLGFRGEALASIAAVSDLKISSRKKDKIEGAFVRVEFGNFKEKDVVGCSEGTKIEVKDLFFNTPVRKKFLDGKEFDRILEMMMKMSLIHTDVRFKLLKDKKVVLDVFKGSLQDRVVSVYGLEVVKDLLKIEYEDFGVKVSGFVSKPSLLRNDKAMQSYFVNERLIQSKEVSRAVYDAYKSLLFVKKHPVVILGLELDGVDVNVHPTKQEIRFEKPEIVYNVVFDAIRSIFREEKMVFEVQEKFFDSKAVQDASLKASLDLSTQSTLGEAKKGEEFSKIPNVKLLGCIGKTYWVGETVEGLVLIDQHVVQERILYEKFMKEYIDGNISVQKLISPEVVDLDVRYASRIKDNLEKFKEFGFEIEEFGDNTFRISTVPVIFGSVFNKIHLLDLLGDMRAVKDYKEKVVIRMACRSSIKAGDEVSEYRLMALLRELDKCELPFTCPHGRPIIIKLGMSDLEKMFRRK